jgi:virginiamycin B lyase
MVVVLVAASVAAITWSPSGGHTPDRVTANGPAPPPVSPEVNQPVGVPTTVVAGAPGPVPVRAPSPKPAVPTPATPPPTSSSGLPCTLSTGYPLTIPEAITTGRDGALWFTQPGVARIGRLTTAGAYSSFPVSGVPGSNNGIATGPDGGIWFSQGTAIGRITGAGTVRSYTLPNGGKPGRIITGSDGALWFIETNRPVIGRMTVSGDVTEYGLSGNQPARGIVAGPDDAVWVARGNVIRISNTGDVKEYAAAQFPQDNVQPEVATGGIVAGQDGAIWFITEHALHRMTTDGHDTIENGSATPTGPQPPWQFDLAVDGNGDFWISTIAVGGSSGGVDRVSGQSPQDRQPAKGYTGDAPIAMTTGPGGAIWIGTSPSTAKGPPYGPSNILRLTTSGTTVVKALPCPS